MDDFLSLFLQYSLFLQNYQRVRRFKDPHLDESVLIKKRQTNETFILKEEFFLKESQFEEIIAILKHLFHLNKNKAFAKLIAFSFTKDDKTSLINLFIIYEYCESNLEKEIALRMKNQLKFEETYLIKLLNELIETLIYLKNYNFLPFDLNPQNIYLHKNIHNKNTSNDFESLKIKYFYKSSKNNRQFTTIFDYSNKSEIFDLGSLMLYLTGISNVNSTKLYNKPADFLMFFDKIEEKLEIFSLFYSKKFLSIIKTMLDFDINKRVDLDDLLSNLSQISKKNRQKSKENSSCKSILSGKLSTKISSASLSTEISTKFNKSFGKLERNPSIKANIPHSHLIRKSIQLTPQKIEKSLKKHSSFVIKTENSNSKPQFFNKNRSVSNWKLSENQIIIEAPSWKTKQNAINAKIILNLINDIKEEGSSSRETPKELRISPKSSIQTNNSAIKNSPNDKSNNFLFKSNENKIKNDKNHLNDEEEKKRELKTFGLNLIKLFEENLMKNPPIIKKIYQDNSVYYGEMFKDQRTGQGVYYYSHGEIYAGEWLNDRFQGKGIYIYDNFEVYEGELKENMKEGFGVYRYLNGNTYEGLWRMNKKNGYGVLIYGNNGEKYEGNWLNGEKQGKGVYYFKNGNKFEGSWENSKKNGKGLVKFADGSIFEGEWKLNSPNGFGSLIYANGDIYQGNFLCGIKEGDGIYMHKVGDNYEGKMSNDICQDGIYSYSNNDKYIGKIKDSKREEYGEYYYASGDIYKGQWKNNLKHGLGVLYLGTNIFYDGEWKEGKREGFGTMLYKNKEKYEGLWNNDQKDIKGKYSWPNGSFYEGEWKEDKMNGKGIYLNESGEKFIGFWIENLFVKENKT